MKNIILLGSFLGSFLSVASHANAKFYETTLTFLDLKYVHFDEGSVDGGLVQVLVRYSDDYTRCKVTGAYVLFDRYNGAYEPLDSTSLTCKFVTGARSEPKLHITNLGDVLVKAFEGKNVTPRVPSILSAIDFGFPFSEKYHGDEAQQYPQDSNTDDYVTFTCQESDRHSL